MSRRKAPEQQIIRLKAEVRQLRRQLRDLSLAHNAELAETLAEACAAHYARLEAARDNKRLVLAVLACLDEKAATPH